MEFTWKNRFAGTVLGALTAALVIVACVGTHSIDAGFDVAGQEGHLKYQYTSATQSLTLVNSTGDDMDVSFKDRDGNQVGDTSEGVTSGGSVDVPSGAATIVITSPSTHSGGGSGGNMAENTTAAGILAPGSHGASQARVVAYRVYRVRVGPLVPDEDGTGLLMSASFDCKLVGTSNTWDPQEDGWEEIKPILLGGGGTFVPNNMEIVSFVRAQHEPLGVRFVAADQGHFTGFHLTWNGDPNYADLYTGTDVQSYSVENGWEVCSVFVPFTDFNPATAGNAGTLTMANSSDPEPQEIALDVVYFP